MSFEVMGSMFPGKLKELGFIPLTLSGHFPVYPNLLIMLFNYEPFVWMIAIIALERLEQWPNSFCQVILTLKFDVKSQNFNFFIQIHISRRFQTKATGLGFV